IDEYYPWWKEALDKYDATQHMLSPTYAQINGDEAITRTDVQAVHYPNGETEITLTLWATYKTDMRRVNGEWKISRHELLARGMKRA
ncbi:MAG: nuclear transport factor 2 family protein, partial [Pseudomonadales bacterium]|nr:nuclear transport factor 2 family protein [Pseudomonadales bacterium]